MNKLLFALLLSPLFSIAQPKYENDTLYTSCGYKIYKGQTLHFGNGSRADGKFRFVNIKSENASSQIANQLIVVKKMKNFGISVLGNAYIEIIGKINYSDGSKGYIDIHMAFDNAIKGLAGLAPELLVPEEFNAIQKGKLNDELRGLHKLYEEGILTKEEYEKRKQKLLEQ